MIWLECKSYGESQRVLMVKDPIGIGRSTTCEFSFAKDPEVSRMHAIVEKRGKFWYLSDQKSTNGSFVNGQRVTVPFPLKEGDVVEIGAQLLRVVGGLDFTVRQDEAVLYRGYPHLYLVLKTPQEATAEEIDAAYTALKEIFNPELHPGNDMVQILLKDLDEAYAVLGDPARRAEYDATLSSKSAE